MKLQQLTTSQVTMMRFAFLLVIFTGVVACGNSGPTAKSYQASVDKQEGCCRMLESPDSVEQCLSEIPRLEERYQDSKDVAAISSCVEKYFQCDAASGQPTPASAQLQYDCIQDLGLAQ